MVARVAAAAALCLLAPDLTRAQPSPLEPTLTLSGGYAGFLDESVIPHGALGLGAEWMITRRVTVGPEVLVMIGPGSDRDVFVLGVVRVGLLPFNARVAPFVTAGGGLMRHDDRFGGVSFSATEGVVMAGGGVRVRITPRIYVAPEVTVGWEPHLRASVSVGMRGRGRGGPRRYRHPLGRTRARTGSRRICSN